MRVPMYDRETFVRVAGDCPVSAGEAPKTPGTLPWIQFHLLYEHPYRLTFEDLLVQVTAQRLGTPPDELEALRDRLFAQSQACMRASMLPKRYGWGVHIDEDGLMALWGRETNRYAELAAGPAGIVVVDAMRASRSCASPK